MVDLSTPAPAVCASPVHVVEFSFLALLLFATPALVAEYTSLFSASRVALASMVEYFVFV